MPDIKPESAPAPWHLKGEAWVAILSMPEEELDRPEFLPPALHGQRLPGRHALLMAVRYSRSDVGPYDELLFVPGRFRFPDGKVRPSISRILVSTQESVANGRQNWGIPKERGDFQFSGEGARESLNVKMADTTVASLSFRAYPPPMPAPGRWLPRRLRTVAQHRDEATWCYAPAASGTLRPARLIGAKANPDQFPDITRGRALLCARLSRFNMTLPVARIKPDPT